MSSRTYKYDALAAEVKLKDITSCRHNRALLHRIKNNDPGLTRLPIVRDDDDYDQKEFVVRESDDLGWLGYFVGRNERIENVFINHLPADKCCVETMFEGFQRSKTIASLYISGEDEDYLGEGFSAMNLPHLTSIEVHFPFVPEGTKYLALGLHRCKSLKRYCGRMTAEIVTSLSSLPMLEFVGGEGYTIPQDAWASFGGLLMNNTTLKGLDLYFSGLGDEGLIALSSGLASNRSLTDLYLCNNNFSDDGLKHFAPSLAQNKTLLRLCATHNNIGDEGAIALGVSLAHNRSLKLLEMSDNNIGDKGLKALAPFVISDRKLKWLRLSNNNIGDQGLESFASALSRAPNRSRLRCLSLDGNTRISARGFVAIARILQSRKCNIDDLNLSRMNIGEKGGSFLAIGLSSNKSLLTLSLRNASIDNVGVRNLAVGLSSNNSLQKLDLSGNRSITAAGLSHFKRYFQSSTCSLQVLDIYSINIGDEGALALVDALAHNKSLEKLGFLWGDSSGFSGLNVFSKLLCDSSTPNSAYLSNHTLGSVGCLWGWDAVADEYQSNISPWLELNKNSSSSNAAAKVKVLRCFPDLNMTPLFQWDMKLLPFAKAWFEGITPADKGWGDLAETIRSRELSVIYIFVRGMPVWVSDDYKKYFTEQLNRLDATKRKLQDAKRKLQEEIQQIEERERRLVEG